MSNLLRSWLLKKLEVYPPDDLNDQLRILHSDGRLDEAAALLKKWHPADVCQSCGGTGADEGQWIWDHSGGNPGICQPCEGTGSKSKRPVWNKRPAWTLR